MDTHVIGATLEAAKCPQNVFHQGFEGLDQRPSEGDILKAERDWNDSFSERFSQKQGLGGGWWRTLKILGGFDFEKPWVFRIYIYICIY